jgi:2-amino-4-hydroxy-6-hydroxymethyldihydropteridine diphosphokinase|nr:MAG: 2-amino-4-hydroxy-6-hydroxymethyldihydropteridine diphosphokinase [Bacteroidota bacterium]
MPAAYIGVGSNLGDREGNLERAARMLARTRGVWLLRRSRTYESPPHGPSQTYFYNQVWEIWTDLEPEPLLDALLAIEARMGRRADRPRWAPRVIDLDLLLYADRVSVSDRLQLPHPRMRERAFVLEPLLELLPEGRDPVTGLSFRELRARVGHMPLAVVDGAHLLCHPLYR